jgi:Family of unknown function (DUF6221)
LVSIDDFIKARIAEDEAAVELERQLQTGDGSRTEYVQRLMECLEKRARMELYGTEPGGMSVLKHLASGYADHPDYRKEWA